MIIKQKHKKIKQEGAKNLRFFAPLCIFKIKRLLQIRRPEVDSGSHSRSPLEIKRLLCLLI